MTVDERAENFASGVFAAGDVVAGAYWRVAAALGQGSFDGPVDTASRRGTAMTAGADTIIV